jgi:outer membrane PBP1 activator LpoA protein
MIKQIIPLLFFLFILLLNGCYTSSPTGVFNQTPISSQKDLSANSSDKKYYQQLSKQSLLMNDDSNNADQLINNISGQKLNSTEPSQQMLSTARTLLQQDHPRMAIQKLEQIKDINVLSDYTKTIYYANATYAYLRAGQVKNSIAAEIMLNDLLNQPLLTPDIWQRLHTLPLKTLLTFKSQMKSKSVIAWLDLVILSKQQANQPRSLIDSIQNWQKQYPHHAATQLLPQNKELIANIQSVPPEHIALLLPLQGPFAKMGLAVRDGFMTAFYEDAKRLSNVPDVKVYDTSQTEDIITLYHQAVQEGAQFVIGPLTKSGVERLSKSHFEVPTLTLNYLSKKRKPPKHLIQFGLSSERAAKQAATHMWYQGISSILLITPANDWGKNIHQSFSMQWKMQGGKIVSALSFENREQLSVQIPAMLNIDQSIQRGKQLEKLLGKTLRSIPRRRQDFDGIFFAGTSAQAKQIQPLLKFYYAGDVPTFSIFSIYPGYYSSKDHWDFEGIYFNDIPWVLVQDHVINFFKERIQLLWPAEYRFQGRLFALGIDSYLLSILLPRLIAFPDFPINGVTGQLYLTADGCIHQQLLWAQFGKEGIPRLLT